MGKKKSNRPEPFTVLPGWSETFFDALAKYGTQEAGARAAGVTPGTITHWKKNNEEFNLGVQIAKQRHNEILESELARRAIFGRDEPVIYRGQIQYQRDPATGQLLRDESGQPVPVTVKRYSDQLLLAKLKAEMPHKYGGAEGAALAALQRENKDAAEADTTKEELTQKLLKIRETAMRSLEAGEEPKLKALPGGKE